LGFLRRGPSHAYEIHRQLQATSALGLVWHLKQSQLYALLARLEEAGYLYATTETQGPRPPRRRLYLTPAGTAALQSWLVTPVRNGRDFRQEFLAKLYFAQEDGPGTVAALLAAQRAACETLLGDLQRRRAATPGDRPFARLVYEFRIGQMEACLAWLDLCAAQLG
jgi:DNA-binding PadR family transcriptional regulator